MHFYARVFIVISMLLAGSGTGGSVYGQPYHVQNWVLSIGGFSLLWSWGAIGGGSKHPRYDRRGGTRFQAG